MKRDPAVGRLRIVVQGGAAVTSSFGQGAPLGNAVVTGEVRYE
jgi:hypothetical protein